MIALMRKIASSETAEISDDALALITRAAEGSARDATSLLDQAISHGAGETTADQVRAMLGLADRGRVLDLFDMILRGEAAVEVETGLRLVAYQPGRITVHPTADASKDLVGRLGSRLQAWTGNRWVITVADGGGAPTIAEVRDAAEIALKAEAESHPMMQAIMATFPKAKITEIRTEADKAQDAFAEALPEVDDEWDPFDDE